MKHGKTSRNGWQRTMMSTGLAAGVAMAFTAGSWAKRGPEVDSVNQTLDTSDANDMANSATASPRDQAIADAEAKMTAAAAKARATYEATPDWTNAMAAYLQARSDYNSALTQANKNLMSNADYAAAVDARDKAEAQLDTLRSNGASGDDIASAAAAAMAARTQVTKMKGPALATDAGVMAAQGKLTAATAALNQQRVQEQAAVDADPDYQAAKKALEDAKGMSDAPPPTSEPSTPPPPAPTPKSHHHKHGGSSNNSSNSNNSNSGNSTNSGNGSE